jgi:hypothetical protein
MRNDIIRSTAPIIQGAPAQVGKYHRPVSAVGEPLMDLRGRWMNYEVSRQREVVLDEDFVALGFAHSFPSSPYVQGVFTPQKFYLTVNGESPFTLRGEDVNTNFIPLHIFWNGADYMTEFAVPYYMPKGTRITFRLLNVDSDTSHQFQLCGYHTEFSNEMNLEMYPKPHFNIAEWTLETGIDDAAISTISLERNADFIMRKIHSWAEWDLDNFTSYAINWGIGVYNTDIKVDGVGLFLNRPSNVHCVAGSQQKPRVICPDIRIPRGAKLTVEANWRIADTTGITPNEQKYHWMVFHGYDIKQ